MFSIVMPIDPNRLEQFKRTKMVYDSMPQAKEFIMPTRNYKKVRQFFKDNDLLKDVKLIAYEHERGFNPSMALNMAVRQAKYDHIIVTSPEVMPTTPVLEQLEALTGKNVICQVLDAGEDGKPTMSLVQKGFRDETPAMYFLAMFNKGDIEAINGWDEEFMKGYAYEDNDFGERWQRAELPFEVHDEIRALHQYHPRSETIPGGAAINLTRLHRNRDAGVIRPQKGLIYLR